MSDRDQAYCLIGSDGIRRAVYAGDIAKLEAYAVKAQLRFFAIYRNAPGFHSAAQREFLLYHRDDPYWLNRGVESAAA